MFTSFQQTNGFRKSFQTSLFRSIYFSFSYDAKMGDTLNVLRHSKFVQMLATSSLVEPSDLPPTERAPYYHALRVHLQVTQRMSLDPTKWGWKFEKGHLVPIKNDIAPAPDFLLNFIRRKCKITSKKPCGTTHCSCRGLKCCQLVVTAGENCAIIWSLRIICSIMTIKNMNS